MPASEPRINLPEVTVSELSTSLKRTIEDAYGYVRVRGELGGVKYHSSGHVYLDLKDDRACLAGVVWKTTASRLRIKLEAGLEVSVTGRITTFPGQSKYQIVIDTIEPAGLGALMALLEERKKQLAAEGLFDEARKQLLPYLPRVIGVITSPTGAVIRDILHRLTDRFPREVLVWPVRVQGNGAAEQVAEAIRGFNALPAGGAIPVPDVLIVARGGGSLEDLWAFNEEIVVRAASESLIPLISAIGHETDITLLDFVADRRAPTPTAAAEIAVPVRAEIMARIDALVRRQAMAWRRNQDTRRTELRAAARALPAQDMLLALPRQRLDNAADRLPRALLANAQQHHTRFTRLAARLNPSTLKRTLEFDRQRLVTVTARARTVMERMHERRVARLERAGSLLKAFSYRGVLERGFALVRDETGAPLRSAAAIGAGQNIAIEFADGGVDAVAGKRHLTGDPAKGGKASSQPATPSRKTTAAPAKPQKSGSAGQGDLF
jgi:exodeoxyribonuclease VII large subunit